MSVDVIKSNIESYKRKFYLRKVIKGVLFTFILFIPLLLLVNFLENTFWFSSYIRLFLLMVLLAVFTGALIKGVILPLLELWRIRKPLSDENAAIEIGQFFPEIRDKLVNYLQINKLPHSEQSLVAASIRQRTNEMQLFDFKRAIDFTVNKKYLIIFCSLVGLVILLSFISPPLMESTKRIILYSKEFKRQAPFEFVIQNDRLEVFRNEDLELKLRVEGKSIPEDVYINVGSRRIRMRHEGNNFLSYTFSNVQQNQDFHFDAAGFYSDEHGLLVLDRPELRGLNILLDYPAYTGMKDEELKNSGNMIVPEGTVINWKLNTSNVEKVELQVAEDTLLFKQSQESFEGTKIAKNSFLYELRLFNKHSSNKSRIAYSVEVINDQLPQLETQYLPDTLMFKSIVLTGEASDDYGISSMRIYYRKQSESNFSYFGLPVDKASNTQRFYSFWEMDSLRLAPNELVELYVSVRDNDQVNGPKEVTSRRFYFQKPDMKKIDQMIGEKSDKAELKIDQSKEQVESLNEKLEELEERLKTKNKFEWQEEKLMQEILEDREKIEKSVEELKKEFNEFVESKKEFKEESERIQEKTQQLQDLMNEILDEETKKLYDELKKLLEESVDSEKVLDQMNQISRSEKNLEEELERALELFKRLKLESMLEENSKKLDQLGNEQKELGEENKGTDKQEMENRQEEINQEFDEIKKEIEDLQQLNQELQNPEPLQDMNKELENIEQGLEDISDELENGKQKDAGQKQQSTGQKMKDLSQMMADMQSGMEMMMMQENLDHLKHILDNLVKLSFDEERILEEIRNVQQVDPRFIELSQEQLKLINNAEVVEDSLRSLASRVTQISNFVTREVDEINRQLESAMTELKERNKLKATSHQQFAMTSMNNLALLLDDVMQQMQMAMAEAMGKPQKSGNKPQNLPGLGELQKELSKQIQELKKSGKSGRELSEELARMAAEQAMIRQKLEEMEKKLSGQPGGEQTGKTLQEIIEKMDDNETDLVNKRLTETLMERQQDIITRMLEAEESMREQKLDPEREGEEAGNFERKLPPAYEEYLKARKSEIELLQTVPLELNPFYKKEVNDYFRRLSGKD